MIHNQILLKRVRLLTCLVIAGLLFGGATALPLRWEVDMATRVLGLESTTPDQNLSAVEKWLVRVKHALHETDARHPFLYYGTDWLAFGHFVIAIAFVGALRDPVRNRWLFDFGLIACVLVIPFALIFGAVRGIPIWWRLVDCSFGVIGFIPLWFCRKWASALEADGSHADCED